MKSGRPECLNDRLIDDFHETHTDSKCVSWHCIVPGPVTVLTDRVININLVCVGEAGVSPAGGKARPPLSRPDYAICIQLVFMIVVSVRRYRYWIDGKQTSYV